MNVHETLIAALGRRDPLVVAPVSDAAALDAAGTLDLAEHCDVLELRLDALTAHLPQAKALAEKIPLPVLITARHPDEGACEPLSAERRHALLEEFLPLSQLIDVEIRALDGYRDLVAAARQRNVLVVASSHDFSGMPNADELAASLSAGSALADIVKLAVTPRSMGDLFDLASIAENRTHGSTPVAVMGMGALGRLSRLVCASAGSVLNYGYLTTPNAPGQWPAAQLKTLIGDLREQH